MIERIARAFAWLVRLKWSIQDWKNRIETEANQ